MPQPGHHLPFHDVLWRHYKDDMPMSNTVTGTDVIRVALQARVRKLNTASLARDLGLSSDTLDQFASGKRSLPPDTLKALTKDLWGGHAEYDPAIDRLRPAIKQKPTPLGSGPPPITETMTLPTFKAGPAPLGPQPVKPIPPKPKAQRPGWVE